MNLLRFGAQPQPTAIITARMGTEVHGGVNYTGTAVGRGHRFWGRGQGRYGMRSVLLTGDAVGLVGQAGERCGRSGALAWWWHG